MGSRSALWASTGVICDEPLLFVREEVSGRWFASLLFRPSRLVRVRHPEGHESPLDQFKFFGSIVEATAEAGVPFLAEEDLYRNEEVAASEGQPVRVLCHPHFCEGHYFHDLQVLVDYETEEKWDGPVPTLAHSAIPCFRSKGGRVVLIGDSISEGANASALTGATPFQPPYIELFARDFREQTGLPAEVTNLSKGGKTSKWGLEQMADVTAAAPDLVIIAFGMNEPFDGITPTQFRENIAAMIQRVQQSCPEAEFILMAGMSPNPRWHVAMTDVRDEMYRELLSFSSNQIAVCDVRSTWDEIERRKGFWSITGNGLNHPNDYGHRLYADCLLAITVG